MLPPAQIHLPGSIDFIFRTTGVPSLAALRPQASPLPLSLSCFEGPRAWTSTPEPGALICKLLLSLHPQDSFCPHPDPGPHACAALTMMRGRTAVTAFAGTTSPGPPACARDTGVLGCQDPTQSAFHSPGGGARGWGGVSPCLCARAPRKSKPGFWEVAV